ncbi:hypothetical protein A8C37_06600 [Ligilactobacillus salivarius]|nr:hypothetical protein A8C37_06600 [Ligilactobacillus salivarius]
MTQLLTEPEDKKVNDAINKLNSQEYVGVLNNLASSVMKQTISAPNEATVASIFERELYYFVKKEFDITLNIEKEVTSQDLAIHNFKGRIDAITTNLVIEYKKPEKLRKDKDIRKAQTQLSDYLKQLRKNNENYFGIITDGSFYVSVYFIKGSLKYDAIRQIDGVFFITLIKSILGTNKKQLVSRNIIDDFSLEGHSVSELSNLQKELFRCLNNETKSEKVLMLFGQNQLHNQLNQSLLR